MSHPTFPTNLPLTVVKRCAISSELEVDVTIVDQPFRGRIFPPREANTPSPADASPRSVLKPHILWYKPGQAVGTINNGDIVDDEEDFWEVIQPEHGKRAGLTVLINEAWVLKVSDLYPFLATIGEESIPVALWRTTPNDTSRGGYMAWAGEAPPEWLDLLRDTNQKLQVGTLTLNVDDVTLQKDQPHVALTLRQVVHG